MTMDERLVNGRKALEVYDNENGPLGGTKQQAVDQIIRAAFPELFSTPPQGWIAPWEATDEMISAADALDTHEPFVATPSASADSEVKFAAMRTAHLSQPEGTRSEP